RFVSNTDCQLSLPQATVCELTDFLGGLDPAASPPYSGEHCALRPSTGRDGPDAAPQTPCQVARVVVLLI
ncbi:MAG TPA: hypothetical protein VMN39_00955, partial [Longimicrobiaceae bacterium]|nr:hypothetical protein [Longimicrobiaceae bacterium]